MRYKTIATKNALEEILAESHRARLIPTAADSRKEERIASILLATLSVVRPFAKQLLRQFGVRMTKTARLHCYTEVKFPNANGTQSNRPDGLLRLEGRQSQWTALVEAKISRAEIDEEQVRRYGEIARQYGIDAVITLSNQLVSLPRHVPYSVPKKIGKHVDFFHVSWMRLLTNAELILRDKEGVKPDVEQAFILGEMVRYFEHKSSGVKRFEHMNQDWRALVLGIRNQHQFTRTSPEIENTIASWYQEERDICLILSRYIGERVDLRLTRKYQLDPALRLRDSCQVLSSHQELRSRFVIPNAADDLAVTVNLGRRTISCSMRLSAPLDRKRATARINWLVRQLRKVDGSEIYVRVFWPGRLLPTQATLQEAKNDPKCLDYGRVGVSPKGFEVLTIKDCAGRFSGTGTFIKDLEEVVPDFYEKIGQHIYRWIPPAPAVEKREVPESVESPAEAVQGTLQK